MRIFVLTFLVFFAVTCNYSYSKPVDNKNKVVVTEQIKRVNKKANQLENKTKEMLVVLKKLLEKRKKDNPDFLKREIK